MFYFNKTYEKPRQPNPWNFNHLYLKNLWDLWNKEVVCFILPSMCPKNFMFIRKCSFLYDISREITAKDSNRTIGWWRKTRQIKTGIDFCLTEVWQITSDSNTLICKYLICELICLFSEKQALIWVFDLPWEVIWIDLNWNSGWIDLKFKSNANHWPYRIW